MIRDGLEDPEKSQKYCDDEISYVIVKNKFKKSNSYELDFDICLSCSDHKSNFCVYGKTTVSYDQCEGYDLNCENYRNTCVSLVGCQTNPYSCAHTVAKAQTCESRTVYY